MESIMHRYFFLGIAILLAKFPGFAYSFCNEPSMFSFAPDSPGTYGRPSPPHCLSGYQYSGKHTCSEWEINSYVNEVNDYIGDLQQYAEEAETFAEDAAQFASEARLYARCEADQAKETLN